MVCDNLSTDKTAEIVKSYEIKGVQYVLNTTKGTAEENWNFALDFCKGDLIALYHADDVYLPSMISQQVKLLSANPDVCSVFVMASLINENGEQLRLKNSTVSSIPECNAETKIFDFQSVLNDVLKYSNFIKTPTLVTRRETFNAIGKFNLKYKSSADLDLWLRMARYKSIGIINKPLFKYRISGSQGSAAIYNRITELPDFFRVCGDYIKNYKQLISDNSLGFYNMIKGGELILCSMNLILTHEIKKAKNNLKEALTFQNAEYAASKKRMLLRYVIGFLFYAAIFLGISQPIARVVNKIYTKDKNKWNQPLK